MMTALERAHRHLIARRLPYFAAGWLASAIRVGAPVSLGAAEASARTFASAVLHRGRESERARELEASHDAYRDLAENARDFIYRGDLAGRITYVNESLAAFIGAPVESIVGRRFADFLSPHPANPDLDAVRAWLAAGEHVPPLTVAATSVFGVRWVEILPSGV